MGTRGSRLALTQAVAVRTPIERAFPDVEVEIAVVSTAGDRGACAGDKSRWVAEIERELIDGRIDVAVHSAKDVPSQIASGTVIAAIPAREDARDALVCASAESIEGLPEGATVGTSSPRRRAQLLAARPDLRVVALQGNVDTRLRKLERGDADALLLAMAGLARLGVGGDSRVSPVKTDAIVPAAGQGALALQSREGDARTARILAALDDPEAHLAVTAERSTVAHLGADCHTPVGVHAQVKGDEVKLVAHVGSPDGSEWIRDSISGGGASASRLGSDLAERLFTLGAREILEAARATVT